MVKYIRKILHIFSPALLGDICIVVVCCSVTQSCLTFCDPIYCSMRGFPVHHCLSLSLLKLTSIESVVPSNHLILCHPLLLLPSIFLNITVFSNKSVFASAGQSIGASASASAPVLPMNVQGWFPLGLTGLISLCPRDFQESSPTPQFESINSSVLSFLYSPTLTSIHDYRKNHSFDYMDLCWQSDISAF